MTLSIFSCASWPSVCLLWRNVLFQSSADFFPLIVYFLILSSMNCLYILEINPLSVISFENTFSHSEGCLFILFMVSFDVQKLLSLVRSNCLFLFLFSLFKEVCQKDLAVIYIKECFSYVFLCFISIPPSYVFILVL